MSTKKLILIDGNAIFYRAFHSLPLFKTSKGVYTNAIHGFLRMLMEVYKREKPDFLAVAWDTIAKTYRHEEYKEYKAHRAEPPAELYPQLPKLKEILQAFTIPPLAVDGFEADDLIGTLTFQAEKHPDLKILILTGDQDTFQLVSEKTNVVIPIKGVSETKVYDIEKVKEKFGLFPKQIVDYKALCGDSSDNIKGVRGIGPKQAISLLQKYETLENLYEHLQDLPEMQRKKLEVGKDNAFFSKRLVTIQLNAPVQFDLSKFQTGKISYKDIKIHFEELEFRSLVRQLDQLQAMQSGQIIVDNIEANKHEAKRSATSTASEASTIPVQQSLF